MPDKKLGRPPSPPEEARSHRVVTFVTPAELAVLQKISEKREQAMSATVHQLLREQLQT